MTDHRLLLSRRHLLAGMACLALPALAPATAAAADGRAYSFSPVNQYGLELTASYWNPIVQWVSARSGVPLALKVGRTSADTIAFVLAREVDFSFNNHVFTPEREKLGWRVFGRRSSPNIRGQIVTLEDSPVHSLEQLRDEEVAFPGPEAVVAYKFTYAQLLARGIPVKVVFASNHDAALSRLASGRAKAVGVNGQVAEGWAQREGRRLRVLWQSEPLPELALLASQRVAQADFAAVQKAFLEMHQDPEGRKVLAASAALVKLPADSHFIAADAADFRPYLEFFRTAPVALR